MGKGVHGFLLGTDFLPEAAAEFLTIALGQGIPGEMVVLGPGAGDFQGPQQGGQTTGLIPVHALFNAVQQTGPISVAATRGVQQGLRLGAGNDQLLPAVVNVGAVSPQGDDQGVHPGGQLVQGQAGAFAEQFGLVIVEGGVGGLIQEGQQLFPREHGHALTRIEDEGNAAFGELLGVADHAVPAVRRHNAQAHPIFRRDLEQGGIGHGPRVEGGDLVVVQVRGDEGLGGEAVVQAAHMAAIQAQLVQPLQIGISVLAHGGHDQGFAPEQLEAVGDVASAAAEFPAQFGHQEGDIKDVDRFRQNVVLETVRKDHDVVVGDGAADQGAHGRKGEGMKAGDYTCPGFLGGVGGGWG